MLSEDDVVETVAAHLEGHGYRIETKATTRERGYDIVAKRESPLATIYVEAKGETSNRQGSARYGQPFSSAQCRDHVANAFYAAAAVLSKSKEAMETRSSIALAVTPGHRKCVERIQGALDELKIGVFWVHASRDVQLKGPWPL